MIGQFSLTQMDSSSDEDAESEKDSNGIEEFSDESTNEKLEVEQKPILTQRTSSAVDGLLGLSRKEKSSTTFPSTTNPTPGVPVSSCPHSPPFPSNPTTVVLSPYCIPHGIHAIASHVDLSSSSSSRVLHYPSLVTPSKAWSSAHSTAKPPTKGHEETSNVDSPSKAPSSDAATAKPPTKGHEERTDVCYASKAWSSAASAANPPTKRAEEKTDVITPSKACFLSPSSAKPPKKGAQQKIDGTSKEVNVSEAHWEKIASSLTESSVNDVLTPEELEMIKNAVCNTKKYQRSNNSIEARFFDTIKEFGGPALAPLCEMQQDGLLQKRRVFYILCKGKKTDTKYYILNKCLTLCSLKWKHSRTGKTLESSTFVQYIKQLFTIFRKEGVEYDYLSDFNKDGEFHAVTKAMWIKAGEEDQNFGSAQHKAAIDEEADTKIRTAIEKGHLRPFTDLVHLQMLLTFLFGRYFLLRGGKEIHRLEWKAISFGRYTSGPDKDCRFVMLKIPKDKVNYRSFRNPIMAKGSLTFRVRENTADVACPYRVLTHYRDLCPPIQIRIYCQPMCKSQKIKRAASSNPVERMWITNPNKNVGINKVQAHTTLLGEICGFQDFEKCKNHGNRAYAVTTLMNSDEDNLKDQTIMEHCRHRSLKSQMPYHRQNAVAQHKLQNALSAVKSISQAASSPTTQVGMNNSFIPNNQVETKLCIPSKVPTKSSVATPSDLGTVDSFEEEFPSASIKSEDVAMNNRLLMMSDMMSVDRTKIEQLTAEIEKHKKEIYALTAKLSKAAVSVEAEESRGNFYKRKFIDTEQALVGERATVKRLKEEIESARNELRSIHQNAFITDAVKNAVSAQQPPVIAPPVCHIL
jgi:hypothetical protein